MGSQRWQRRLWALYADPWLSSQEGEGFTVINVSTQQPFTAEGCQPRIRVGMHGV